MSEHRHTDQVEELIALARTADNAPTPGTADIDRFWAAIAAFVEELRYTPHSTDDEEHPEGQIAGLVREVGAARDAADADLASRRTARASRLVTETEGWKHAHAAAASRDIEHDLVEQVIAEFLDNLGIADKGLPAYGIRKVAHYAAQVARAHVLAFDPNLLRLTPQEATSEQLALAATAVLHGTPVHLIDPDAQENR